MTVSMPISLQLSIMTWITGSWPASALNWILIGSVRLLPAACHSSNAAVAASGSYSQNSQIPSVAPGMPGGMMDVATGLVPS